MCVPTQLHVDSNRSPCLCRYENAFFALRLSACKSARVSPHLTSNHFFLLLHESRGNVRLTPGSYLVQSHACVPWSLSRTSRTCHLSHYLAPPDLLCRVFMFPLIFRATDHCLPMWSTDWFILYSNSVLTKSLCIYLMCHVSLRLFSLAGTCFRTGALEAQVPWAQVS